VPLALPQGSHRRPRRVFILVRQLVNELLDLRRRLQRPQRAQILRRQAEALAPVAPPSVPRHFRTLNGQFFSRLLDVITILPSSASLDSILAPHPAPNLFLLRPRAPCWSARRGQLLLSRPAISDMTDRYTPSECTLSTALRSAASTFGSLEYRWAASNSTRPISPSEEI